MKNLVKDLCLNLDIGSNSSGGGAQPQPPQPIQYLTAWKVVGNSEVVGTEIWSCGEYSSIDNKYHILVQPLGKSVVDIALAEPLRKINDAADTLEFPSETEGKALLTRRLLWDLMTEVTWRYSTYSGVIISTSWASLITNSGSYSVASNIMAEGFNTYSYNQLTTKSYPKSLSIGISNNALMIYDSDFITDGAITQAFTDYISGKHLLVELATPTTELVDAPQIEESTEYNMIISQGAKAVSWSSFNVM